MKHKKVCSNRKSTERIACDIVPGEVHAYHVALLELLILQVLIDVVHLTFMKRWFKSSFPAGYEELAGQRIGALCTRS